MQIAEYPLKLHDVPIFQHLLVHTKITNVFIADLTFIGKINMILKGSIRMIKQLAFALLATFVLFVPTTYAHTALESTNPGDGATVTEELQTIELKYSGKIEEGSVFKVLKSDGTEVALDSITLNNGVLTGKLASPLPNDTYTVEWDSISEDGHPLSGSFSFTVNVPAASGSTEGTDATTSTENTEGTNTSTVADTSDTATDTADDGGAWTLIIIVGIIIIALAIFSAYSYKRAFVKKKK